MLGSFMVGDNAKIGAGSVVLREVPPNSTVVGIPGKIVKVGKQMLPDPVAEMLAAMLEKGEIIHELKSI